MTLCTERSLFADEIKKAYRKKVCMVFYVYTMRAHDLQAREHHPVCHSRVKSWLLDD